jgi:myo-inositol 2-dehydrogenase/D-chiro-inositol 1-dehydrogenase
VVADPRREAAERGKVIAGAEEALTDIEKAIAHPAADAVVIVTPTDTHARLLELAADAGKAVFSEKPIALDLAETTRVVRVIQERGIPVQLGFMRRYDPGYARAKQKIAAGDLGRIELFRALSRDTYPPSLEFLLGSGGIFLDMAVHDLDLARNAGVSAVAVAYGAHPAAGLAALGPLATVHSIEELRSWLAKNA